MIEISSKEQFETEVLKSKEPVLVDFYATWCGPCKMMAPVIKEISEENALKTCKIDIDENQEIAEEYNVLSIPTFMVFKDGEVTNFKVGVMPKEDVLKLLK